MKHCSKCACSKTVDHFGRNKSRPGGLAHWCKECQGASNRRYYRENTSAARGATRKWNSVNAARKLQKQREWHERNPDFERSYRKWRRILGLDLETDRAQQARRRAAHVKATPQWSNLQAIRDMYVTCRLFSTPENPLQMDHIVPLLSDLVCGLHVPCNLQVLPAKLNQRKGNRYWPDMP